MSNAIITIHNVETNEVVVREMTDAENLEHLERLEAAKQDDLKFQAFLKAKENALKKLQALGLTPEDLKALGLQNNL